MFRFDLEPAIPLLTVTQKGVWTAATVATFEPAFRQELKRLLVSGRPTSLIVEIKATVPRNLLVTEALCAMVARLGHLNADRTAVVSALGFADLQAGRISDPNTRIFTSIVQARGWVTNKPADSLGMTSGNEPSDASPEGSVVHVRGPADVDFVLTPAAALETAKRISDAAVEVLLETASAKAQRVIPM
ncbi:hypothetical protein [Sphingomonas aerolata]|uniref:hypothetical protein n=1 Tax=Sphingomonas aerolata TaxID=185951 RepID=UPI0033483BA8